MRSLRVLCLLLAMGAIEGCASLDTGSVSATVPSSIGSTITSASRFAKPPPGFVAFCERSPDECKTTASELTLALDARTWETLERVNSATNRAIAPKADIVHYGTEEYWTIPTDGYGDCDDYVLAKRSALIASGVPESALRIAVVFTSRFVRHTVLTIATDKGTYVLDNLRGEIVSWGETDYGWIKHQDPVSRSGWSYF